LYAEHFGLKENPFSISPDPHYLFMSEGHQEALAHLLYGINSDGGFVLLTGEVGAGKTTVCRCLLGRIPENTDTAFVLNPKLTVEELLATICDELGIVYPEGSTSVKQFTDRINAYLLEARARGRKTVLIIEEAQNLMPDVLEQIRLLTNLETDKSKLLQIIMLGQPELGELLARPGLKQTAQRITARYHLGPLSKKDVEAYVSHRLWVAGCSRRLFAPAVVDKIYRLSGGIPRLINILCDRCLLGAYVGGREKVDSGILAAAADEVFGRSSGGIRRFFSDTFRSAYPYILAGSLLLLCAAVSAAVYYNYKYRQLGQDKITAEHNSPGIQRDWALAWLLSADLHMQPAHLPAWPNPDIDGRNAPSVGAAPFIGADTRSGIQTPVPGKNGPEKSQTEKAQQEKIQTKKTQNDQPGNNRNGQEDGDSLQTAAKEPDRTDNGKDGR